tara:strand:+ start:310 stop:780 length:471 start_codon:yes stop_codon:yes gene_type:complete
MSEPNSAEINSAKIEKMFVSLTSWLDIIPKIQYLPSDEEVIPGTERYKDRLPKWLLFVELTKYVRYWTRENVSIANICSLTKYDTKKSCKELGLSREHTKLRIRAQEQTRVYKDWGVLFQHKLWEHQKRTSTSFRVGEADIMHYKYLVEAKIPPFN